MAFSAGDYAFSIQMQNQVETSDVAFLTGAVQSGELSDLNAVAETVANAFGTDDGPTKRMSDSVYLLGCFITDLTGTLAIGFNDFGGADNKQGQTAQAAVAPQLAVVITKRTTLAGRAHRGRFYHYGSPVGGLESGQARWTTTWVTQIADAYNEFWGNLVASSPSCTLQVASKKLNVVTEVSSLDTHQYLGTQRRRAQI